MKYRSQKINQILLALISGVLFYLLLLVLNPSRDWMLMIIEAIAVLLVVSLLFNLFKFNKSS